MFLGSDCWSANPIYRTVQVDKLLLQVGVEVPIPAVEAYPRGHWQEAGPKYRSVVQVVERQKRLLGEELLPDSKGDEQGEANDQHSDDVSGSPLLSRRCGEREGQQEEGKSCADQDDADNIELDEVMRQAFCPLPTGRFS